MSRAAIVSKLKEVVDGLPDDWAAPANSVENYLTRQGVKPEELKWSQVYLPTEGRVTKQQLQEIEKARTDQFITKDNPGKGYQFVSLREGQQNPTYAENITQFTQSDTAKREALHKVSTLMTRSDIEDIDDNELIDAAITAGWPGDGDIREWLYTELDTFKGPGSGRYKKSHFSNAPDYLMHTRTFTTPIEGVDTHVVQELQSDLHQTARQAGGYAKEGADKLVGELNAIVNGDLRLSTPQFKRSAELLRELSGEDAHEVTKTTVDLLTKAADELDDMDTLGRTLALDGEAFLNADSAVSKLVARKTYKPEDFIAHWNTLDQDARVRLIQRRAMDAVEGETRSANWTADARPPKSPYEKNWLRKSLEREIANAVNQGLTQIAVPIKGSGTTALSRAPGVDKWYDTTVRSTVKKLAKAAGGEYVEMRPAKGELHERTKQQIEEAKQHLRKIDEITKQMSARAQELDNDIGQLHSDETYANLTSRYTQQLQEAAEFRSTTSIADAHAPEDNVVEYFDDEEAVEDLTNFISSQEPRISRTHEVEYAVIKLPTEEGRAKPLQRLADVEEGIAKGEYGGPDSDDQIDAVMDAENDIRAWLNANAGYNPSQEYFWRSADDIEAIFAKYNDGVPTDQVDEIVAKYSEAISEPARITRVSGAATPEEMAKGRAAIRALESVKDHPGVDSVLDGDGSAYYHFPSPERLREMLTKPLSLNLKSQAPKKQKFELYSPAAATVAAGAVGASMMQQADPEFVAKAKERGYTDEQIAAYLETASQGQQQPQQTQEPQQAPGEVQPPVQNASTSSMAPQQQAVTAWEQQAVEQGYTKEQIDAYKTMQAQEQGTMPTPDESLMWVSDVPGTDGADQYEVLPEAEVKSLALSLGVDPYTQEGINTVYDAAKRERVGPQPEAWVEEQRRMAEAYDENVFVAHPWQDLKELFGQNADAVYKAHEKQRREYIIQQFKDDRGLNVTWNEQEGKFFIQDPNNPELAYDITPGILDQLGASKYEVIGGVAGAMAGLAPASRAAAALPGWQGKLAGAVVHATATATGLILGDQIDYLAATVDAQEEWHAKIAFDKAVGKAQEAVVWDTVGYGVMKLGAASWRGLRHAYNYVKDGNTKGAYEALKHALGGITDDEVQTIITRWEDLNQKSASGITMQQKALQILPSTTAGGESVIGAASALNSSAATAIAGEINARAQSLLKATRGTVEPGFGKSLLTDLKSYQSTVKTQYDLVKTTANSLVPDDYRFVLPKLAIKPLLEHKIATIADPVNVDRLQRSLEYVNSLTAGRSFEDLIELRQMVNDFRFNSSMKSKSDQDALYEVLGSIDGEINKVMRGSEAGTQWLSDWKDARKAYTEMKNLEGNVLFKAIIKQGASSVDLAKQAMKYAKADDDTYKKFMQVLSPVQRREVENSITEQMAEKFTVGVEGGFKATNFPAFARELRFYQFNSPDAARIKEVVDRLAEVYRNDVKLAYASGKIQLPSFQSYLTTDPVARAQYELASSIFRRAKELVPGNDANSIAMVRKVAELLEEPLNPKTTEQVLHAVRNDQNLTAAVKRMQAAVAKARAEGTRKPNAKLYKDSSGKLFTKPGTGRREANEIIPAHRMIGEEALKLRLGTKKLKASSLTKLERKKLLDDGFAAIVLSNGQVIKLY